MKVGIIGSGIIVQEFLPKLIALEGIEIVAVQGVPGNETQVKELCAANGVPHAVFSFEALTALDIDTVYIAVPNFLHFTYCKQALEVGLNVIVEKPITSNLTEAQTLRELAEEKQLFLFEAVTTVYFDSFAKIKEWLGRIGTVKMVHCNYSQYSRRYDAFRSGTVLPAFDPAKSGGALMDLNLYNLHFVMGLFGAPDDAVYYANIERGIDTSGTLAVRIERMDDTLAVFQYVGEGLGQRNLDFAKRKANTVAVTRHCSLWALAATLTGQSVPAVFDPANDCLPVGGSLVKYAVIGEDLAFGRQGSVAAPRDDLAQFKSCLAGLYAQCEETLDGIAVSLAGTIDPKSGHIYLAGAFPFLAGKNIRDVMPAGCALPVTVENDANSAAIAEARSGALAGVQDAVVILLGSSIGGAILQDGAVRYGRHFSAAEFSLIKVRWILPMIRSTICGAI